MFLVDHMFALFFRFLLDFLLLFLNPFENPFSLLSATQILRADESFSSALALIIIPTNWNLTILQIILSIFASHVFTDDLVNELFATVELDSALSVAAVPKAVMQLFSVRCFVTYEKHILLFAGDVGHHAVAPRFLLHVPNDLRIGFTAIKFGARERPEL